MKVIPPNFGYVEEAIFRCGAPEPRHYGFLASLGLRACVLLTDTHDDAFVHWLQETGVMIFCPLLSEAQTRGTVRSNGGGVVEGVGFPPSRSSGGMQAGAAGASTTNNNNINMNRLDEVREDTASPSGALGEAFGSGGARYGPSAVAAAAAGEVLSGSAFHDGADGAEGGFDGSGNFNGEETTGVAGGRGVSWGGTAGANNGMNATTSNAARFLRANVTERQVSTKFSPVLVQEPVYFPGGGEAGSCGGPAVSFTSAPTYEGRLHGLMTLSEAVVVSILHIVLDPQYYPLLITCSKGRYRSGIICGCLRKLQRWNLVSILEEYRRFAANKSRADNEEFIELFDEELVNLELSGGRRPSILYNV